MKESNYDKSFARLKEAVVPQQDSSSASASRLPLPELSPADLDTLKHALEEGRQNKKDEIFLREIRSRYRAAPGEEDDNQSTGSSKQIIEREETCLICSS